MKGVKLERVFGIFIATVLFVTLFNGYPAQAAANLVSNPGFESGKDNWYELGESRATTIVTPGAVDTSKALCIGTDEGGLGQLITGISAGNSYTLSGFGKVSVTGETAFLGVDFLDSNGRKLSGGKIQLLYSSTSYAQKAITFTPVKGTVKIQVFTYKNPGTGYVYLDNINLENNGLGQSSPSGLAAATVSSTYIGLSWNEFAGAGKYKLYRDNQLIYTGSVNAFTDTGLTPGTVHTYKVSAVTSSGETAKSTAISVTTASAPVKEIFDDFAGTSVNTSIWEIAYQQWGGENVNGGVLPGNISVNNGMLVIQGNGDKYEGTIKGINNDGSLRSDGKRTGGSLRTINNFASGSYEVKMKVLPQMGACSAMWTYYNDGEINHEIDIEMPGTTVDFSNVLNTVWIDDIESDEYRTSRLVKTPTVQDDGEWHVYRFDWHTDPKRVDFYRDGILTSSITTTVPFHAGKFWVGVWFPNNWCGDPNFATDYMYVDYVRITPFNEAGDVR